MASESQSQARNVQTNPAEEEEGDGGVISPVTTEGEEESQQTQHQQHPNNADETSSSDRVPRGSLLGEGQTKPVNVNENCAVEVDSDGGHRNSHKHTETTAVAARPGEGVVNIKNTSNRIRSKMDDDSLGLQSASESAVLQQLQQREPEGSRPKHRVGDSRKFSEDLQEMMRNSESHGGVTPTTNGDTAESSPPGVKEISISRDRGDVDKDEDENDEPTEAPMTVPVDSFLTPPPAPMKHPQPQEEHTKQNDSDNSFLNNSMDVPSRLETSFRPPSVADHHPPPPESDLSVFSVHSGFAVPDANGLPPRIVPGTMVASPAVHHQYPPNIHANIHGNIHGTVHAAPGIQAQHPINSTNGYHQPYHPHSYAPAPMPPPVIMGPPSVGKRKVHFRLLEDVPTPTHRKKSFLSFRRHSSRTLLTASPVAEEQPSEVDRGRVTVSWYEGTTTLELMEHVRTAVIRKLGLDTSTTSLGYLRILDEGSNPPEEIVLSPYIPSGSRFLLRFTTRDSSGDITPPYSRRDSYTGGAPESPSAAPSPHISNIDLAGLGLNSNQLALLGARLKSLQMPSIDTANDTHNNKNDDAAGASSKTKAEASILKKTRILERRKSGQSVGSESPKDDKSKDDDQSSVFEMQSLHPEDQIQKSLQSITNLLMLEREKIRHHPRQEKRQVIFVIANYFVLFISLIAISAEIQDRAPGWNAAIERHLTSVKNCSKDQDALFECVSNGDFSGLVASVVLWISRSAATKRIFLFGFDSPRKLWTVVYESLVTAVCWAFSYIFIRRGLNPDTSRNFLQKYWKDAMYGSLAGFSAAFMKHILKNLIPQEAIEDALHDRQLKILSWLPSFA